jgi:ER degradation enhancer, mannosidase alpha-like 3
MPESVRRPLKNMVSGMCPRRPSTRRKLHAAQFQVGNPAHLAAAREMGVAVVTLPDGRLQLLHTAAQARSAADAEEGLVFMHEMLELSKAQAHSDAAPLAVSFTAHGQRVRLAAGPAHFGHVLRGAQRVTARIVLAEPMRACAPLVQPEHLAGRIAVIERGDCMFIDKVI